MTCTRMRPKSDFLKSSPRPFRRLTVCVYVFQTRFRRLDGRRAPLEDLLPKAGSPDGEKAFSDSGHSVGAPPGDCSIKGHDASPDDCSKGRRTCPGVRQAACASIFGRRLTNFKLGLCAESAAAFAQYGSSLGPERFLFGPVFALVCLPRLRVAGVEFSPFGAFTLAVSHVPVLVRLIGANFATAGLAISAGRHVVEFGKVFPFAAAGADFCVLCNHRFSLFFFEITNAFLIFNQQLFSVFIRSPPFFRSFWVVRMQRKMHPISIG